MSTGQSLMNWGHHWDTCWLQNNSFGPQCSVFFLQCDYFFLVCQVGQVSLPSKHRCSLLPSLHAFLNYRKEKGPLGGWVLPGPVHIIIILTSLTICISHISVKQAQIFVIFRIKRCCNCNVGDFIIHTVYTAYTVYTVNNVHS